MIAILYIILYIVGAIYATSLLVGIPWMAWEMRHAPLEDEI